MATRGPGVIGCYSCNLCGGTEQIPCSKILVIPCAVRRDVKGAVSESYVQVNIPATAGKKLKTYESVDGSANVVESEAVTLTDSSGNELLGQKPMADSVPVVFASNQTPLPITITDVPPATSTVTTVPVPNVTTVLLAANPARQGAMFFNNGDDRLYLKLGAGASSASFTVRLDGRGYYEVPYPVYTGAITAILATAGPQLVQVTELSP